MNPIHVIGIGEDGLDGLSKTARGILDSADVIAGGARHLAMLGDDDTREHLVWEKGLDPTVAILDERRRNLRVVVVASGDPLLHGIAVKLIARLGADAVHVLPSVPAFSLAAARMGWALADPMLKCVSVHALPFEALNRMIRPGVRLLILSRTGESPAQIAAHLTSLGYGDSLVTVLERMGGAEEKRTEVRAGDGFQASFENLNTVAVACVAGPDARPLSTAPGLPDDAFDHDGTITKSDVRAVTLSALGPLPGEILWDVGAGSGTVAIEWLRVEPSARAVAFEQRPERIDRIRTNAKALGVPGLRIVEGTAPACLQGEDAPDSIFIGGGIAGDSDVLRACLDALKPGGRLVANAVTLEAQAVLMEQHKSSGGHLVRIGIASAEAVGGLTALRPALDVLQWRMTKS